MLHTYVCMYPEQEQGGQQQLGWSKAWSCLHLHIPCHFGSRSAYRTILVLFPGSPGGTSKPFWSFRVTSLLFFSLFGAEVLPLRVTSPSTRRPFDMPGLLPILIEGSSPVHPRLMISVKGNLNSLLLFFQPVAVYLSVMCHPHSDIRIDT